MNVLIISANPNPKSFNNAIQEAMAAELRTCGHTVKIKDLYEMHKNGWKPVMDGADMAKLYGEKTTPEDIKQEQNDVSWAQALAFIYPIWWYGQPSILKGWIDRTMQNGFAFSWSKEGTQGLLKHRCAVVIQTAGEKYETDSIQEKLIKLPMTDGVLGFCGIKNIVYKPFYQVTQATDAQRAAMLDEVRAIARAMDKQPTEGL